MKLSFPRGYRMRVLVESVEFQDLARAVWRPEHLVQLARAGVTRIQPGIEALDTELLTSMKKGCTMLGKRPVNPALRQVGAQCQRW